MSSFYKTTFLFSLITLVSRILGLIRDIVIAGLFGVSIQADVFFLMFRPFDLLRKLMADGMMTMSLVPVLTGQIQKGEAKGAGDTVIAGLLWVSVLGIILIAAGFWAAPVLAKLAGPGLEKNSQALDLAISLMRTLLPYVVFIGFSCVFMGTLHSLHNFYVPGAGSAVFNGVIILTTVIAGKFFGYGILSVAMGVCLGGFVQVCIQLPWIIPNLVAWRPSFSLRNPGLLRAVHGWLPCVTGAAAYQINVLIASLFASFLDWGNVSVLYFADRLIQFPLALIGSTCATVLLPSLSGKAAEKIRMSEYEKNMVSFEHHFFFLCLVSFSALAGLLAVREPLILLLFHHGSFGAKAAAQTASCLGFLLIGLWAYIGSRLFASLYHAMGLSLLPFYAALISFGINFLISLFVWQSMGIQGLALSISVSAMAGFSFLFCSSKNPWRFQGGKLFLSACRAVFVSAMMGIVIHCLSRYIMGLHLTRTGVATGIAGCVIAGVFLAVCGAFCFARKSTLFLLRQHWLK